MKTRNSLKTFLRNHIVVFMLACFASSACGLSKDTEGSQLREVAQKVYRAVRKGDIQSILTVSSQRGITVALRRADWTDFKAKKQRGSNMNSTLDDLAKLVWEEREIQFDLKSQESVRAVTKALGRFRHNMEGTYGPITIALTQTDSWNVRELGPTASGKVASDAYWYIYFRRENGEWKVWKFEFAVH